MVHLISVSFAGVALLLASYFWNRVQGRRLARQWGCLPLESTYSHIDPILGLDLLFQNIKLYKTRRVIRATTERYKVYGKTFQHNEFGSTVINTIDPDNIRVAYTDMKRWGVEDWRLAPMEPFCGRGFITTDGPDWERSRSLMKPTFAKSNVSNLAPFEDALNHAMEQLPSDGTTVDLAEFFRKLFLNTATQFTLGYSLSDEIVDSPVDSDTFLEAFHGAEAMMGLRFLLGRLSVFLPKKKWLERIDITHRFLDHFVEKALIANLLPESEDKLLHQKCLLRSLVEQTQDKAYVRNQVLQLMMATQDTTSVLLSNTFWLLSRHPDIWGRFRAEVRDLGDQVLTFDLLKSMKLLRKILNESLRIYPLFVNMGRISLVDTTLPKGGGPHGRSPIFVPAGTRVINNFYALHREDSIFGDDVESFNPDRWDTIKPDTWEYMPFAAGPRSCVGQPKALAEASLVLAKFAKRYKKVEIRDQREWDELLKLSLANANGCKVGLVPVDFKG